MKASTATKTPLRAFLEGKACKYKALADLMGLSGTHIHFLIDGERQLLEWQRARLVEIYGEEIRTAFPNDKEAE